MRFMKLSQNSPSIHQDINMFTIRIVELAKIILEMKPIYRIPIMEKLLSSNMKTVSNQKWFFAQSSRQLIKSELSNNDIIIITSQCNQVLKEMNKKMKRRKYESSI